MKAKIQRELMTQFLNRVQNPLKKADPVSSLVVLSAKKDDKEGDTLSAAVFTDTLLCVATLDASKEPTILSVEDEGTVAVDGNMLLKGSASLEFSDMLELEFEPRAGGTDDESDEVGSLKIQAGTEKLHLQCVDRVFSIDPGDAEEKMVVSGEDFVNYAGRVKIAAGKPNNDSAFSNVSIELDGDVTYVTTNGQQLAVATYTPIVANQGFSIILPYDALLLVSSMCSNDQDVRVSVANGKPVKALFTQKITYAMSEMGEATYRIISLADKFPNFKAHIDRLSFVSSCKVSVKSLKGACGSLDVFEQVRATMELDIDGGRLRFDKKTPNGRARRSLQITEADGDQLELDISSRHFAVAASSAIEDEIELKLSGSKSLGLLDLGGNTRMYFMPFVN